MYTKITWRMYCWLDVRLRELPRPDEPRPFSTSCCRRFSRREKLRDETKWRELSHIIFILILFTIIVIFSTNRRRIPFPPNSTSILMILFNSTRNSTSQILSLHNHGTKMFWIQASSNTHGTRRSNHNLHRLLRELPQAPVHREGNLAS